MPVVLHKLSIATLLTLLVLNLRYLVDGAPDAIAFFVSIYDVFDHLGLGPSETAPALATCPDNNCSLWGARYTDHSSWGVAFHDRFLNGPAMRSYLLYAHLVFNSIVFVLMHVQLAKPGGAGGARGHAVLGRVSFVLLTLGTGEQAADIDEAMKRSYAKDVTDEFVEPIVVTEDGKPVGLVKNGDSILFFNFRADRARQITRAFTDASFDHFALTVEAVHLLHGVTEALADSDVAGQIPSVTLSDRLAEVLRNGGPWLEQPVVARALECLGVTVPGIETPLAFTNGDYNPLNFLSDGGRLTGIVDFAHARFEDPRLLAKLPLEHADGQHVLGTDPVVFGP